MRRTWQILNASTLTASPSVLLVNRSHISASLQLHQQWLWGWVVVVVVVVVAAAAAAAKTICALNGLEKEKFSQAKWMAIDGNIRRGSFYSGQHSIRCIRVICDVFMRKGG